jgi:3'-phosphoadenosine 5'-phosphosulfate sulfotransferase (PAPS reductase)/FAD synthetase
VDPRLRLGDILNRTLRAKPSFVNDVVTKVWQTIGEYVTADEAQDAVDKAAAEVRAVCGPDLGNVVYGWSGGKDSLALQVVMEKAGVRRAVLGTIPHLEFRSYLAWVDAHQPEGLVTVENRDLTVPWLADPARARYLFPRNSRDGYFWTLAGTRRAQLVYQEQHQPALQIYGRRTADGNHIGQDDYGIHRTRRLVTYCPLRDWPHELVLGVIHYAGMELPPVYSWPHGWTAGTGSWPGRRVGTYDESWAETFAIEPDRVREAAEHIDAARAWLDGHAPATAGA